MTNAKLALAIVGILVWGYGTRIAERRLQWLGIALVAAAFLLRFAGRSHEPPVR